MTKTSLLLTSAIYLAINIGTAQAENIDWSGAYAGLSFDYSAIDFGSESNEDGTYGGDLHPSVTGTLGYNFQQNGFVYGFEALITNGGQFDRQEYSEGDLPDTEGGEYHFNWSATLRAKAGIAQGNTLLYGALGATYADVDLTRCDSPFGNDPIDCGTQVDVVDKVASGVWGANIAIGAEFAINPRLSGFVEYNVSVFDEIIASELASGGTDSDFSTFYLGRDQLRLGVNYAFADRNTITSNPTTDATWAGSYIGALASAAKTSDNTAYYDSAFKGGQWDAAPTIVAGYNWQKGNVVYGIEGDITGPLASSKFYYEGDYKSNFNTDWTATLRGRVGITSGNALFFATAGIAASKGNIIGCESPSDREYLACEASIDNNVRTNTDTLTGFTAGFGLEYAVSSNLKLRGEYLHIAYPQLSISEATAVAPGNSYEIRPSANYDIIRLGVVYDFAPGTPMPETQSASWDGAFGGIYASNIGFQSSGGESGGTLPHVNTHSFNGGVKAGYNWQNGSLVFGVVADLQSGTNEGVNYFELSGSNDRNTMESDWTAGLNLRAGMSSGNLLLYVTGGMSASQVEMTTCHGFSTVTCFDGTNTDNESTFDDVLVGFNAGFGAEMMISPKTSIFAEYVMHRYGSVAAEQNQAGDYSEFYVQAEQLKLGVNVHF